MPIFKRSKETICWNDIARQQLVKDFRDDAENRSSEPLSEEGFVAERLELTKEILKTEQRICSPLQHLDDVTIYYNNLEHQQRSVVNFVKLLYSFYTFSMKTLDELAAESTTRKKFLKMLQKGMRRLRKKLERGLKRVSKGANKNLEDLALSATFRMMKLQEKSSDFVESRRKVKETMSYSRME